MIEPTLKPCPLCGGRALGRAVEELEAHRIGCTKCTLELLGDDLDVCAEAWNTRPREDALREALEACIPFLNRHALNSFWDELTKCESAAISAEKALRL